MSRQALLIDEIAVAIRNGDTRRAFALSDELAGIIGSNEADDHLERLLDESLQGIWEQVRTAKKR